MQDQHAIALAEAGSAAFNTLVVRGCTIVVPLQQDLDDDPLQDDEVRLSDETETVERIVLASDEDAVESQDERVLLYHFRDVPPGIYRVSVRVGGVWQDVLTGLLVTASGVQLGDEELPQEPEEMKLEPDDDAEDDAIDHEAALDEDVDDELDEEAEVLGEYMDLNDAYREVGEE